MLFDNPLGANFDVSRKMIETVLAQRGIDLATSLTQTGPKQLCWSFQEGSARVQIFLNRSEQENSLRVIATVMIPPTDAEKRAALLEKLLVLNARELRSAAFGLENGQIVLVGERSTAALDLEEVSDLVHRVASSADHYDDLLVAEFGGKLASNSVS